MLFDLEDYMQTGMVGRLDFVPEKNITNSFFYVSVLITTARATRESLFNLCKRYFSQAILDLPNELKPNASQKLVAFFEAYRLQAVKGIPYWNMIGSFKVKTLEGGYQFQDGDRYSESFMNYWNGNYDKRKTAVYKASHDRGRIDPVSRYNNRYSETFEYNNGGKYHLSGELFNFVAIMDAIEGSMVYQSYDPVISDEYYLAFTTMMSSIKELIIACEGYETNLQ